MPLATDGGSSLPVRCQPDGFYAFAETSEFACYSGPVRSVIIKNL
jgi:hypothetical protein